ncbi:protein of unknown function [Paraburkholderia kururiensis]
MTLAVTKPVEAAGPASGVLPLPSFPFSSQPHLRRKKDKFVSMRNNCLCHIHANPGDGMLRAQILPCTSETPFCASRRGMFALPQCDRSKVAQNA